jgi:orotidine-5'-phosphate decarboxylase
MEVKNKIIVALDVQDIKRAIFILEDVSRYINTVKIGLPLVLSEGIETIMLLKEKLDCNIIADFKVADIPETNEFISDITFKAGADAIIVHGFVGEDSVVSCFNIAKKYEKDIFLLTEMSHPGSSNFLDNISEKIAIMGKKLGINNFVAPATKINRLKKIRRILGADSYIISPGVGFQGGDPKETLKYADALIIGRSITESKNPKEAVNSIINYIEL